MLFMDKALEASIQMDKRFSGPLFQYRTVFEDVNIIGFGNRTQTMGNDNHRFFSQKFFYPGKITCFRQINKLNYLKK
jgi:hypothetical protein